LSEPADRSASARDGRPAPLLYLITDRNATAGRPLAAVIERALAGAAAAGVTSGTVAVQLREKDLEGRALLELARPLRALTEKYGATLYVNDRVDVALAAGADGVHLGGASMAPSEVAAIAPSLDAAISAHDAADFARARGSKNLRFAVLGPIFDTPSKRGFGAPLGLNVLSATARAIAATPILALGGITVENARACVAAGADGIACIRAVLSAPDPEKIAFLLCRAILESGFPAARQPDRRT
jgi:thiamine-phosphate pyrophosphorylase